MGLFGGLFAGVSGLNAQSNKIGQISNNIANVNTVGFKEETAAFNTLVVPSGTTTFAPGGVISSNQQLISKQGIVQGTSSGTDLAINGNGFFAVSTSPIPGVGQLLYTRVGSFTQDANGNFVNANGMYLQGWALTSTGAKPANSTDPTTSLSSVKIQSNASGVAAPTTTVSMSGNLNASLLSTAQGGQPILLGSGETLSFNNNNANNVGNNANQIIVGGDYPDAGDPNALTRGDSINVTTNNAGTSVATQLTYGGFTVGRSVNNTTVAGNGDSATLSAGVAPHTGAAAFTSRTNADFTITTGAGAGGTATVTVTTPYANGLQNGEVIGINGAADLGGILSTAMNGNHQITVIDSTHFSFTVTSASASTGGTVGAGNSGGSAVSYGALQPQSFRGQNNPLSVALADVGTGKVTVTAANSGYKVGDTINITGVGSAVGGIPATDLNGTFTITSVSATQFTFTAANSAVSTGAAASGGGTAVSFANRTYPFAGNILDANSQTADFLGQTTTAPFDPNALSFQIATSTGSPIKFKYVTGTPDPTQGQFNNMNTLAQAINDSGTLTARVTDGRLYVGALDANQALTFINGQSTATASGQGIDWTGELGLENVPPPTTSGTTTEKRFNSLTSLETQINTVSSLTSSISQPTSASSISINASDPSSTIQFADATGNRGSILQELGFLNSSGSPLTGGTGPNNNLYDTGVFAARYIPSDPNSNMAGGKVTPQFSRNITIYDSLGVSHTLQADFAKVGVNTWAVEIAAIPITDLGTGASSDGQLAKGTISFNGDGTLSSVSTTLKNFNISWADGASTSDIALSFGTLNKTDGISQFSAASNITQVTQDGSSAGQLTGVTIDGDGFVIEHFSNNQSQQVFKIPLIQVDNPNGLEAVSGNAFEATQASGTALSVDAGTNGTGSIESSALEQSTVDLSAQLTNLIVAQQAYGANSKLLTVADQLLQQLDQIIQ